MQDVANNAWAQAGGAAPAAITLQNIGERDIMVHFAAADPGAAKTPFASGADAIEALILYPRTDPVRFVPGGLNVWVRARNGTGHVSVFAI